MGNKLLGSVLFMVDFPFLAFRQMFEYGVL